MLRCLILRVFWPRRVTDLPLRCQVTDLISRKKGIICHVQKSIENPVFPYLSLLCCCCCFFVRCVALWCRHSSCLPNAAAQSPSAPDVISHCPSVMEQFEASLCCSLQAVLSSQLGSSWSAPGGWLTIGVFFFKTCYVPDNHPNLIMAAKIVIMIKIRLICSPRSYCHSHSLLLVGCDTNTTLHQIIHSGVHQTVCLCDKQILDPCFFVLIIFPLAFPLI